MTLSREPIRSGPIYCSPSCGLKCTWAAYEKAVADSSDLAKDLGEGWEPRVWENLGWHYAVKTLDGRVNLHPGGVAPQTGRVVSYSAFVSPRPSIGGKWSATASTPAEALAMVRQIVQDELDGVSLAMEALTST